MLAIHRLNRSRQGQRGHQTMPRPCMSVIQATAPECMYPCVRVFRVNTFGFVYPFYPRFRAQWSWYLLSPPTRFNGEYRCGVEGIEPSKGVGSFGVSLIPIPPFCLQVHRVWLRQRFVDGSVSFRAPSCIKLDSTCHLLGEPPVKLLLFFVEASIRLITHGASVAVLIVGHEERNRTAFT